MKRRDATVQLKELTIIRDLQRLRAEGEAMTAAAALRAKDDALNLSEEAREASAQSWLDAVSSPSVDPGVTALWSADLRRRGEEVKRAALDVEAASGELDRSRTQYNAATLRRDAIKGLARKAEKEDARKHDDTALQDALDRHASRRRK
jgi:hypothetical protein